MGGIEPQVMMTKSSEPDHANRLYVSPEDGVRWSVQKNYGVAEVLRT